MGMVVRSNIMAYNANRQLGMNNSAVSKSLEKLASGFRINRAGDDASGLAISEKMKAQIKGLETASANSQDGISLVQTAEGALTEVHGMLNRMVELATKSANGTMQDKVDREALQSEVESLKSEINRIAAGTNFNGINLLDGSLSTSASTVTGNVGTVSVKAMGAEGSAHSVTFEADDAAPAGITVDVSSGDVAITFGTEDVATSYSASDINNAIQKAIEDEIKAAKALDPDANVSALQELAETKVSFSGKLSFDADSTALGTAVELELAPSTDDSAALQLQIGDTAESFNKVGVSVESMSAFGLGIHSISVADATDAGNAINTIKDAINTVSTNRANLGALQNRLEYTINNLDVAVENMSAANSRIRDTDMAKEMMNYTKMNVLTQAAQAMLAQANQQPQSVLQLLQ